MSISSDCIMTKATGSGATTAPENSFKSEKKKKSIIPKIFSPKWNIDRDSSEEDILQSNGIENGEEFDGKILSKKKDVLEGSLKKSLSERHTSSEIESLNLSTTYDHSMATVIQDLRVFVATWNVGGKTPDHELNLEDFLQIEGCADIYVLGFQEIVPLSAGNVLVIEDNEPASKWLALISHALNKSHHDDSVHSSDNSKDSKSNNIFHKPYLKQLSKNLKLDSDIFKSCNCSQKFSPTSNYRRRGRKFGMHCTTPFNVRDPSMDELLSMTEMSLPNRDKYKLVASKRMVGIFLSIWARGELVKDIGHLRISSIGRGIMGYLGNKGCISISMTLHQTSFCFVCSHLASGEKEGDELRRNSDVAEILKGTQFPNICKNPSRLIPERITDHDRIIWLGDLNYRVGLSYEETSFLLEDNDWDSLLKKDQLNMEREAGRVFNGWDEGKILFAPTYKYSHNSDSYAGETTKSKKKRRTPAWCDRILWRGDGIEQLSYIRGESRFSDHRPVCSVFAVEVETKNENNTNFRKGYSGTKMDFDECIPQRHSFCES